MNCRKPDHSRMVVYFCNHVMQCSNAGPFSILIQSSVQACVTYVSPAKLDLSPGYVEKFLNARFGLRLRLKRQLNVENSAATHYGVEPELSFHLLNRLPGNSESEARP